MKKWILVGFISLVGIAIFAHFGVFSDTKEIIPVEGVGFTTRQIDGKNSPNLRDLEIQTYLSKLASMENCGEGIIDENGLISKGDLCFQKSTYLYFVKKYEIYPYAEENELLSNWGDSWTQREIARQMIEEEVGQLEKHWYTSVVLRKLGLPYD